MNDDCDSFQLTEEEREEILERAFNIDDLEKKFIEQDKETFEWNSLRSALLDMGANADQIDCIYRDVLGDKLDALQPAEKGEMTSAQPNSVQLITNQTSGLTTKNVLIFCGSALLIVILIGGLLTWNNSIKAREAAIVAEQQAKIEIEREKAIEARKIEVAKINADLQRDKDAASQRQHQEDLEAQKQIAKINADAAQLKVDQQRVESAANDLKDLYNDVKFAEMKVRNALLDYQIAYQRAIDDHGGFAGAVSTRISKVWQGGTKLEREAWRRYTIVENRQSSYSSVAKEYNEAAERLAATGVFDNYSLPKSVPDKVDVGIH